VESGSFTGRNIVVLSDGTGQRGGLLFDERRSNIYKLFRATRSGPDSCVDATRQTAFYDPGLGTLPGGIDSPAALARSIYNLASQATGMGITGNIIDCYAEIIRRWNPGDRIFLFGFSRGAYTVRCLGGVLRLCGVPTRGKDGQPIRFDPKSVRKLARAGVCVYNYTNSRPQYRRTARQQELLDQRAKLAALFRKIHGSDGVNGGNARPYFIGVFDTVASLANPVAIAGFSLLLLGALAATAGVLHWVIGGFWKWFAVMAATSIAVAASFSLVSRLRWAPHLEGIPWWKTVHLTTARMKMYDTDLDQEVRYARHAIAIDEDRESFARVPWGTPGQSKPGTPTWFEQVWFAGNHSDIGGSYPEDESRLSDISLKWMVDAASEVGLLYDPAVLKCYPDPTAMQHDECKSSIFRYGGKAPRGAMRSAALHQSVLDRFKAREVLHYDVMAPYRPVALKHHSQLSEYYRDAGQG
jgi:uncharacterized protein (DUF2235 family)